MSSQEKADGVSGGANLVRGVAAFSILSGLTWAALTLLSGTSCLLAGAEVSAAIPAAILPSLALCALGAALWRTSRVTVPLALTPLVALVSLGCAGLSAPAAFWLPLCATSLTGLGRFSHWAMPSWGLAVLLPFLFSIAVPAVCLLVLERSAPEVHRAGWQLLKSVATGRTAAVVAGLAVTAAAVATTVAMGKPLPAEGPPAVTLRARPSAAGVLDLLSWLAVSRIRMSAVDSGVRLRLGRLLEERLGPVQWTTQSGGGAVRVVHAAGRFPAAVYRELYQQRARAFDECNAENSGDRADEKCLREWEGAVGGALRPAEVLWTQSVFRRGAYSILRRYESQPLEWCRAQGSPGEVLSVWENGTRDIVDPGEWKRLAELLRREEFAVLSGTCSVFYLNHLVRGRPDEPHSECAALNPGPEEDFARVELEWWCSGLRCEWQSYDVAAWQRVLPGGCTDGRYPPCRAQLLRYLGTGRLDR